MIDIQKPSAPSNPYLIEGPALISFSMGRSSARMLKAILDAHGGTLPRDVYVVTSNTGKEREESLRFGYECSVRWEFDWHLIEWRDREGRETPPADRYEEVGMNSASRNGEPFKALIRRKSYLPNAVTRFCTAELKIDTMKQFMLARGHEKWINIVGLRSDEIHRVFRQVERNQSGKERWQSVMPMASRAANVTRRDIWRFWLGENVNPKALTHPLPQGFDLGLWPYEGNCDGCFLKGVDVLGYQERERPGYLDDWIGMEDLAGSLTSNPNGARFVTEYSYRTIKRNVERQPLLIPPDPANIEFDAECGLWCAGS